MPKVNLDSMALEDWYRMAQALPYMLKACGELQAFDAWSDDDYALPDNALHIYQAKNCARLALEKLEGK